MKYMRNEQGGGGTLKSCGLDMPGGTSSSIGSCVKTPTDGEQIYSREGPPEE